MEKTIKYTLSLDTALTEEAICGGVQGENNATAVVFEADSKLSAKISEYRNKGYTVGAVVFAVTTAGECVKEEKRTGEDLFAPFYLTDTVTSSGLDVIVVATVFVAEESKEICKAQIKLFFTPSPVYCEASAKKDNGSKELKQTAEEIMSELEEKAQSIQTVIDKKLSAVKDAAAQTAAQLKVVGEIAEEAKETRFALENGVKFVFAGGDANSSATARVVVDTELSAGSPNAVSNSAVALAVKELRDSVEVLRINTQELSGNVKELSEDYIVEQGTDGIWTYRKWASGVAECWGERNITTNITTETGSVFVNDTALDTIATYPFSFVSVPHCDFSVVANYGIWYGGGTAISYNEAEITELLKTKTPKVYIYSATKKELVNTAIRFNVKGRWK